MNERSKLLKYRILFFSEAVSLAHVGRPLKLAKYLAKKGFDVYFAVDGRYNNLIDFDKKKMIELKSQDSEKFKKNMFVDEGVKLAVEAIKSSTQRDVGSGHGIDVYTITKSGILKVIEQEIVSEYKDEKSK